MFKLLCTLAAVAAKTKHYNILSIDGGGIRGLIPVAVIKHMEEESYKIAKKAGYKNLPSYHTTKRKEVIAMKDLFDMTAGTSTGSIIAGYLVYPNETYPDEPAGFSDYIHQLYTDDADKIFISTKPSSSFYALSMILSAVLLGAAFYFWGLWRYDLTDIHLIFEILKKQAETIKCECENGQVEERKEPAAADENSPLLNAEVNELR